MNADETMDGMNWAAGSAGDAFSVLGITLYYAGRR